MDMVNLDEVLKNLEEATSLPKFSPKVSRFIELYALTDNPYESVVRAGYSKKSAYSRAYALLKNKDIRKAIEIKRQEIAERYNVTEAYFIEKLKAIIEDKFTKVSDKISALTLLARITGRIKDRPVEPKQIVILKQEGLEKAIEISPEE